MTTSFLFNSEQRTLLGARSSQPESVSSPRRQRRQHRCTERVGGGPAAGELVDQARRALFFVLFFHLSGLTFFLLLIFRRVRVAPIGPDDLTLRSGPPREIRYKQRRPPPPPSLSLSPPNFLSVDSLSLSLSPPNAVTDAYQQGQSPFSPPFDQTCILSPSRACETQQEIFRLRPPPPSAFFVPLRTIALIPKGCVLRPAFIFVSLPAVASPPPRPFCFVSSSSTALFLLAR